MGLFDLFKKKKNTVVHQEKHTIDPQVLRQIELRLLFQSQSHENTVEPHVEKTAIQKGVANIARRARGTEIPKRAQRVFFCCDARNANEKDNLIADLLSHDAGMDCVVSWLETPDGNIDKELLRNELQDTQALVLWVTKDLLQAMQEKTFPDEYLIAQELRTPILPIATVDELFPEFTRLAGAIHGISQSDSEYRTKLRDQLETFLASEEVSKQIQEKAFTAEIFLSYRKMDIQEARKFMKAFHDLEEFEAISIWYDNFLTAGRNFDFEIKESITNSDAFVLLVTPNLATKGNYVQTTEYPFAQQEAKPVVPVETIPTDPTLFANLFPGAVQLVNLYDSVALPAAFHSKLDKSAYQWQMDSERAWLLGMAYFKGFGVERNIDKAIRLLEIAAKDCNKFALKAVMQLAKIYQDGIGIGINYDKALYWNKINVDYSERLMGLVNPETAWAYTNIAMVYKTQGINNKALEYLGKALAIRDRVLGAAHPDTANTYVNIALIYNNKGDYGKALDYYGKGLSIYEKVFGTEHLCTATTYDNISLVYNHQGNHSKAFEYCWKALSVFEKILGTEHTHTATAYINIAGVYEYQRDYNKALEYNMKALSVFEKILGTEHTHTATTYNNIAVVYSYLGNYGKASEYNEKALSVREKVLGIYHPDTALTYNNIANVYDNQGNYVKALEWYLKSFLVFFKVLGFEHPHSKTIYKNLANAYNKSGNPEPFEMWLRKKTAR